MDLYWSLEEKYFTGKPRRNPIFRDYTLLLYETAGRPGECLAIEFDSIDYNAGTVTIEATLVYTVLTIEDVHRLIEEFKLSSNQIILPEDWKTLSPTARIYVLFRQPFPKTEASLRVIKVSARALAALKRLKLLAKPGQKLVFIGSSGAMLNPDNAEVTFRKIVKGTPLEGATLRTLRSTKATRIAEAYIRRGLDYALARAREILGHEIGSPVTLENYVAIDRPVIDFVDVG
ncbi:hypothetical protein AWN90_41335 [Nocardia terpenica]|uniref:Uncharacterized protein n=2 Tax=Nocardia terpenica TaxID=455432 RepID=A0A164K2V4_9NOCA|nr:hypothetical protein AWN90_41335 [Nocardia terpenica]